MEVRTAYGDLLRDHRHLMKDTVIWNIEEGLKLTGPELGAAEIAHTELYHRVRAFMETYEFLVLPVNQVPPFDVNERYVTEINGVKMSTYMEWMRTCYYISVTGLPAISCRAGSPARVFLWESRSWGVPVTSWECSNSPGRSNRKPRSGNAVPPVADG